MYEASCAGIPSRSMLALGCFVCCLLVTEKFGFLQHFLNRMLGFRGQSPLYPGNDALASHLCGSGQTKKILYGIFTVAGKHETRNVVRQQSQCSMQNHSHNTVFVVGKPSTVRDSQLLALESKVHNDIFILSCDENMNDGKTFYYFHEALRQLPCFEFYAKVDDDTAFEPRRIAARVSALNPNSAVYLGRTMKNKDSEGIFYMSKIFRYMSDMSWLQDFERFHAGMLYILSRSALKMWVELRPTELYGDEDMRTSYYMNKVGAVSIDLNDTLHDYVKYYTLPDQYHWKRKIDEHSLAVHQCKNMGYLAEAFRALCST